MKIIFLYCLCVYDVLYLFKNQNGQINSLLSPQLPLLMFASNPAYFLSNLFGP